MLAQTIVAHHASKRRTLVFPSEVAADSWRVYLAERFGAVRSDRLVSWDEFKRRAIPVNDERIPASATIRLLFARSTLHANATEPFLRHIVPTRYAASGTNMARALAGMLPRLPALIRAGRSLRPGLRADLNQLAARYTRFLRDHELYEPDWIFRDTDRRWIASLRATVVYPELLEDFDDYREHLIGNVELLPVPDDAALEFTAFAKSEHELTAAFDAIERALDRGTAPEAIVLSHAQLESAAAAVAAVAAERDVPIRFATGKPIARLPGARLLPAIEAVLQDDCSVRSLRMLLQDSSIAWRDPELNATLLRFGHHGRCVSDAQWRAAFELAERAARAEGGFDFSARQVALSARRYRALRNRLVAIGRATGVAELGTALRAFVGAFVHGPGHPAWRRAGGIHDRAYSIAFDELDRLARLERRGLPVNAAWSTYLEVLAARTYVPPAEYAAVRVYPYRVAAATAAAVHVVLGASHNATRVRAPLPLGLDRGEREALGWDERDRSRAFLCAYAADARLSASDQSTAGAQIPAAELAEPARERSAPPQTAVEREIAWWARRGDYPHEVSSAVIAGAKHALTTFFVAPGVNYQRQIVPQNTRPAIEHLSPSALDRLQNCPFAFLVRHWRVGEGAQRLTDSIHLGRALHRAVQAGYACTGSERAERIERKIGRELARPEVAFFLLRPGIERLAVKYTAPLQRIVTEHPTAGRNEIALRYSVGGVPLEGRIDRVDDDGALYDFKLGLGSHLSAGKVTAGGDPAASTSLQLPLYALLWSLHSGHEPCAVHYVELKSGKTEAIPGARSADAWRELLAALPDLLRAWWDRLQSGDYRCGGHAACARCRVSTICRSCYSMRGYSDEL